MANYIATLHYETFRGTLSGTMQGVQIVFEFEGAPQQEVLRQVFRWFHHKKTTEGTKFFNRLLACKVDTFKIQPIEKNGYIPDSKGIMIAEWVRKTDPLPEGFDIG